jgi:hypothetical protein
MTEDFALTAPKEYNQALEKMRDHHKAVPLNLNKVTDLFG